jgi:hypothetical protein
VAGQNYTCAGCGANLPYNEDPSVLVLRCSFCGTEQPAPDVDARREELERRQRDAADRAERAQDAAEMRKSMRAGRSVTRLWTLFALGMAVIGFFPLMKMTGLVQRVFPKLAWDGKSTLFCQGIDELELTGLTADLPDSVGIDASGNCHLTLTNCNIKARTAVTATGNAEVRVVGGKLEGEDAAFDGSGNSSLVVSGGAQIVGRTRTSANSQVRGFHSKR